ncbi:methyltransferase-A70 family protein [Mycobacteroides abscessus]|uniref:hypothetical protein n=1 Tax=Mycobacteroides abscessus TaxID=36809 RepID=UPI0009D3C639|nr:hypothetical protein [Mycobacteroides abscessus]SKP38725.1 adenine-specific DNA methyltransferase [Mycobacteroides abscessus subsp. abscessus]SLL09580.1 adenine-specific DNA methyltransferase [Mycobacteroides abscessus subsp. abscessus]
MSARPQRVERTSGIVTLKTSPMPLPETSGGFHCVLADPPWRFGNRRSGMSPESGLRHRYNTMSLDDICDMPVASIVAQQRASVLVGAERAAA